MLYQNIESRFGPDSKNDIKHFNGDISKAKRVLGYGPEHGFKNRIGRNYNVNSNSIEEMKK